MKKLIINIVLDPFSANAILWCDLALVPVQCIQCLTAESNGFPPIKDGSVAARPLYKTPPPFTSDQRGSGAALGNMYIHLYIY